MIGMMIEPLINKCLIVCLPPDIFPTLREMDPCILVGTRGHQVEVSKSLVAAQKVLIFRLDLILILPSWDLEMQKFHFY